MCKFQSHINFYNRRICFGCVCIALPLCKNIYKFISLHVYTWESVNYIYIFGISDHYIYFILFVSTHLYFLRFKIKIFRKNYPLSKIIKSLITIVSVVRELSTNTWLTKHIQNLKKKNQEHTCKSDLIVVKGTYSKF